MSGVLSSALGGEREVCVCVWGGGVMVETIQEFL